MPKRSNDFQRLVYLVKRNASSGATVTESKFLSDLVSNENREVDIVIELSIAGHPVIVSIECVDRNRKAGTEWVEQMHSKHDRLPTAQLVLASRRGFTAGALKKAASRGIQTLPFADASDKSVRSLFSSFTELCMSLIALTPSFATVELISPAGHQHEMAVDPSAWIFDAAGKPLNTFKSAVDALQENSNARALSQI